MKKLSGIIGGFILALAFSVWAVPSNWNTTYIVDYTTTAGSAALGPTAPGWAFNDSAGGLGFDPSGGETIFIDQEIPDCWDGTTDLVLEVYWFADDGDALQLNETVTWDYNWRSFVWGIDDVDHGTIEADTVTYTETANPGDDDDTFKSSMTLVAGSGNQDILIGETLTGTLTRNAVDTYSGEAIFKHAEITIQQYRLKCDHH